MNMLYANHELVYVDPDCKTIVGKVEWNRSGQIKSRLYSKENSTKDTRVRKRNTYPICSYQAAKRIWKIDGGIEPKQPQSFDDALEKALREPYWN